MNRLKKIFAFSVLLVAALPAFSADPASMPIPSVKGSTGLVLKLAVRTHKTKLDCSHLVHDIYKQAGLDYDYQNSRTLYEGVEEFTRVSEPEPGDLIVWKGHVGIVTDPDLHSFISKLRRGVKLSLYDSKYWKKRGIPRFYRYSSDDEESTSDTARVTLVGTN